MNGTLISLAQEIAVIVLPALATAIVGWVGIGLKKAQDALREKTGIEIEDALRDRLHGAIVTHMTAVAESWGRDVLAGIGNDANFWAEVTRRTMQTNPDTVKRAMQGSKNHGMSDLVKKIGGAYVDSIRRDLERAL